MIQVKKKVKVGGIVHETIMSFSQPEWALMQKHYGNGNITFEPIKEAVVEEVDDKPEMVDYELNRVKGQKFFKDGEFEKALYHFEEAAKDKPSVWMSGRINKCKKKLDEDYSNR